MASTQTVTVLFTDLVGSTGLASRIGPAAAEELRREHFTVLREAIDDSEGTEVKNLGDGLMVTFSSTAAAVDCAVGMQQGIEARNRRSEEQLGIRIGLSVGEATLEEDDYFGPPVIEASRLCAKATGSQILVPELVRAMVSGHGHEFKSVGELELKGIPAPMDAFEVSWQPTEEVAGAPLPPRLRGVPPIAFVGRAAERRSLEQAAEETRSGLRRIVLISGEPGIGKTRLATHTALEAHSKGATVLFGRCKEDLRVPYQAWSEVLGHYAEQGPEEVLQRHLERHGGELTRLAPGLASRLAEVPTPRDTDPETERYLLYGAVVGMLEEAARDQPVVLILDDLQWADQPTLALLKHLALAEFASGLLVLGTYRESDIGRGHPLTEVLADLRREEGVERLDLGGLEQEDVVAMMEGAAGHEITEDGRGLAEEIARETDGNPFFVAEMLRHLDESGGVVQDEESGQWTMAGSLADLGLPQSIREVVNRRIERLGEEPREVLEVAAVIGREFDLDLLQRATGIEEDELLDLLDRAVEVALLYEPGQIPGRFSFAHALIDHTLYEELGATRKAKLHHRIAEELEAICGEDPGERVGELAYHWSHATIPTDAGKAIEYCRRAGERALDHLAPDEARSWFEQALELIDRQPEPNLRERCDVLIGLGEAYRQLGDSAYGSTLLEAAGIAKELGDGERMARAALANTRGFASVVGEVDEKRVEALEAALELTEDAALRAQLLSLLAMELTFGDDLDRRRKLSDEAVELARSARDETALAWVLVRRLYATAAPETLEARLDDSREAMEVADCLGDPALRFWASVWSGVAAFEAADMEEHKIQTEIQREIAEETGQPLLQWIVMFQRVFQTALAGDLAAAEEYAEQSNAIGTAAGQPDALAIYAAQLGVIRFDQGRYGELEELVRELVEQTPRLPAFAGALCQIYCEIGKLDEARKVLARFAENGFRMPQDQSNTTALSNFAETAARVGDGQAAALLHEALEPWAGRMTFTGVSTRGSVDLYLGMCAAATGDYALAEMHFAAAEELHRRIDAPTWHARTQFAWAQMLLERNSGDDSERARGMLESALTVARKHGCAALEPRISEALAARAAAPS